jgi:hypothetical protein
MGGARTACLHGGKSSSAGAEEWGGAVNRARAAANRNRGTAKLNCLLASLGTERIKKWIQRNQEPHARSGEV